jgi:uncharacterized membrane protein
MLYAALKLVHVLSAAAWLGGMVFAHFCLRPAAQALEPPLRIALMYGALQRFFAVVTVAVAALLITGVWMMGRAARLSVQSTGQFTMPADWAWMAAGGLLMALVFAYIRLRLFVQLRARKDAADWPGAGQTLGQIKNAVMFNLCLGVAIVAVVVLL